MSRRSGYRGTWEPNRRPYVTLTPDLYVAIQGETSVIGCGECKRRVNINKFITGISTEASVDSPPGSATINLSIPDNHISDFYANDQFIIISMMEVEIYAKGYYTIGGFPQYYKIFWGLVNTISENWSNGVTSISLSCRDILRWWELTNVIINPAFLDIDKSSAQGYQLFQNQFAGANPYTVIIALARESMGDFSITQGSFTSWRPEDGEERGIITSYARNVMIYWQLKFGKIWNNLVLYGSSGTAYTFSGSGGNVSPLKTSQMIFEREANILDRNQETEAFRLQPFEIATFKRDFTRAGDVDFFQNESQTKLQLALTARDQAGAYEFYCDTTGDIIFKPPFYNLNTMPNKPVSWIQDFEIIDESISESEQEVFTHVTSSGNAFGGVDDYGLNDEMTTPRTGVIDWHLLRRYGWRRLNLQLEWAGNPKKLFYHCLDHMDKINSKRVRGTMTIPMRPELRMGFPIWVPKHDAFFYVAGISHTFSPGGQAVTQLTLTAKRPKFIAPKNIGRITRNLRPKPNAEDLVQKKSKQLTERQKAIAYKEFIQAKKEVYLGKIKRNQHHYIIEFPSAIGGTCGLSSAKPRSSGPTTDPRENLFGERAKQSAEERGTRFDEPAILRNIKTGKILGFPNVVMVYRTTVNHEVIAHFLSKEGSSVGKKPTTKGNQNVFNLSVRSAMQLIELGRRSEIIDKLRLHRYEAGFSNAGAYDYAHDISGDFKELSIIPTNFINWGAGTNSPDTILTSTESKKQLVHNTRKKIIELEDKIVKKRQELKKKLDEVNVARKNLQQKQKSGQTKNDNESTKANNAVKSIQYEADGIETEFNELQIELARERTKLGFARRLEALNIIVRPVSDEYGFEVIGHYRYGRGAFVEKGQIQVSTANNNVINQLNIQFSPHGGLLTDNPVINTLGPKSQTFAEAYERMMPDDFVTGASFKGDNYGSDQTIKGVQAVTQATYYKSIADTRNTRTEQPIFVESDALRRAETLAELKPTSNTLSLGGRDVLTNCSCGLVKTSWLSVLPQELIRKMMQIIPPSPQQDAIKSDVKPRVPKEKPTDEDQFRDYFVRVAASKDGLNFVDSPEEFQDLLQSPGDKMYFNKGTREYFATPLTTYVTEDVELETGETIGKISQKRGVSTCGLTVRGILRETGIDPQAHPEFYGPYIDGKGTYGPKRKPGLAVQEIKQLGASHGAWVDASPPDASRLPKRGDIVISGGCVEPLIRQQGSGTEHTFVVLSDIIVSDINPKQTKAFDGVDGGQTVYDPKDKSTNKQAVKLVPRPNGWVIATDWQKNSRWKESQGKFIQGWVDVEILRKAGLFTGGTAEFMDPVSDAQMAISGDPYGQSEAFEEHPTTEGGIAVAQGNGLLFSLEPGGFLDILYEYLRARFQRDYNKNTAREQFAIHGGNEIFRPNDGFEQSNVLPTPSNTLFDRAAAGDSDALNALKHQANFNFGQSKKALEEFKDQFRGGGKVDQLASALEDRVGGMYDALTGQIMDPIEFLKSQNAKVIDEVQEAQQAAEEEAQQAAEEESVTGKASSPLQQAIEAKQRPGASTTAIKTIKFPLSLQKGQHQPPTQPMVLPIPLNLEPAPKI